MQWLIAQLLMMQLFARKQAVGTAVTRRDRAPPDATGGGVSSRFGTSIRFAPTLRTNTVTSLTSRGEDLNAMNRIRTATDFFITGLRRRVAATLADESGMSTVEYAIGTIAAAGFGALLYTVVTGGDISSALTDIIERALNTDV